MQSFKKRFTQPGPHLPNTTPSDGPPYWKTITCYEKGGFTLVEILVVIILLTLAGSLVFMNVGQSMTNRQNKAFSQKMISLCKKARRMAMDQGTPKAFKISSSQRRCWVAGGDPLEFPEHLGVEGEGIKQLDDDIFTICFYPDGSSDGGTLTLTAYGKPVNAFRVDRLTGSLFRVESEFESDG